MLNIFKKLDLTILLSLLGLLVLGLIALYSSSATSMAQGVGKNYFVKQLIFIIAGFVIIGFLYFIPARWIFESAYVIYGIGIFSLLLVTFFGIMGLGAERWIRIGPIVFQPSESAKLATVLALARYISFEKIDLNKIKTFLLSVSIAILPWVLIVRQPDLGTSLVFIAIILPMFYWGGLRGGNLMLLLTPLFIVFASFQFYAFLIIMIGLVLYLFYSKRSRLVIIVNFLANILMGLFTPFMWNQLKPYQQNRIKIFLNPESDPRGAGYQIIQSKVAIGAGGLLGAGFLEGTQTQLRFLPEQHTDFIFAVIGEELGFLGVLFGLICFCALIIRGIQIAVQMKSRFHRIATIGITTVLFFHAVINIGMTVGFFPVTGLPLPFLSYGGSAMLTNMTMIGILLNFYKNKFEY